MNKIVIAIFLVLFSMNIWSAEDGSVTPEQKEIAREFRGTKFLQLDSLEVVTDLKPIYEEIKQNVIDTILLSRTHSQIFAQKRPDGYSNAYSNFYSLEIKISSIEKDEKNYEVLLNYKNWISNSSDKSLTVKINKYNVLNDLRFSLYELLNGKDYVKDNFQRIQRNNFNRIQTIRKNIDEKEKKEGDALVKKKLVKSDEQINKEQELEELQKLKRREKERLKNPNIDTRPLSEDEEILLDKKSSLGQPSDEIIQKVNQKNKRNKVSTNEEKTEDFSIDEEKNIKINNSKIEKQILSSSSADVNLDEEIVFKENEDKSQGGYTSRNLLTKARIVFFSNLYNEFNESTDLIKASTNIRYLGLGGEFRKKYYSDINFGISGKARLGLPIFRQDYKIPSNKLAKLNIFFSDLKYMPRLYFGSEYSTLYNINVPSYGAGLKIYTTKLVWLQFGADYVFTIKKRPFLIGYEYSKSISTNNDLKKNIEVKKHSFTAWGQLYKRYGLGFVGVLADGDGDFSVKSQSAEITLTYDF